MKPQTYDPKKPQQEGIIYGEPNEDYHNAKAFSNSQLNDYSARPQLFRDVWKGITPKREQSKAMLEGSIFHHRTLEWDTFNDYYAVEPDNAPLRPTASQLAAEKKSSLAMERISYWNSFDKVNKGKTIITPEQDALSKMMNNAVWGNPVAASFLDGGDYEVTYRTSQLGMGCSLQCKVDCVQYEGTKIFNKGFIADLKKISSLSRIEKDFADFGYHRQAAYYLKTIKTVLGEQPFKEFFFIFVESNPPYEVAIVKLRDTALDLSLSHIAEDLRSYCKAIKTDEWPSYTDSLKERSYIKPYRTEIYDIDVNNIITLDFPTAYYIQASDL